MAESKKIKVVIKDKDGNIIREYPATEFKVSAQPPEGISFSFDEMSDEVRESLRRSFEKVSEDMLHGFLYGTYNVPRTKREAPEPREVWIEDEDTICGKCGVFVPASTQHKCTPPPPSETTKDLVPIS